MVYSEDADGIFCIAWALFCWTRNAKRQFVNTPFRTWQNHQRAGYHQESWHLADQFRVRIEKPQEGVAALMNNCISENIVRNRNILKRIADAVLYCGRQCIALRGHRKNG